VLFDPFVLAFSEINWHHSVWIWILLLASILIAQGLTNIVWNREMQTVGAAKAAIVLNLQPLMAMMLDFLFFRHFVTWMQIFGALLVFAGVLLATWQKGFFNREAGNPGFTGKNAADTKL
jgi:drug/metabolite transporter (DMT)-like permease